MTINELLDKPVWQMTGEELLFLAQHGKTHDEGEVTVKSSAKEQKHFVYGLAGLARLFGCSLPTANRIKQSGKIDRAMLNFKTTHFPYPQRPSIGVADSFFEK